MGRWIWAAFAAGLTVAGTQAQAQTVATPSTPTPSAAASTATPAAAAASDASTPPKYGWSGGLDGTVAVSSNDNVLAAKTNKVSDTSVVVTPQASVKYTDKNGDFEALANAVFTRYDSQKSENTDEYHVEGGGLRNIGGGNVFSSASWDKSAEDRRALNSPAGAANPVIDYMERAHGGAVANLGDFKLTGKVDYANHNFVDAHTPGGVVIDQDFRDRQHWWESVQVDFTPDKVLDWYLKGELTQIDYRLRPPRSAYNRDSNGYSVAGGVNLGMIDNVSGNAEIGYTQRHFDDPGLPDTSALTMSSTLNWTPNKPTTFTFNASRSVEEDVQPGASVYIDTTVGATLAEQINSVVTLNANASYEWDKHKGIDRSDGTADFGGGVTFQIFSPASLQLSYDRTVQESSGLQGVPGYSDNVYSATLHVSI